VIDSLKERNMTNFKRSNFFGFELFFFGFVVYPVCVAQVDVDEPMEHRIDGVTKLVSSGGAEVILDSETGYVDVMINGRRVKTKIMTPEERIARIPPFMSYNQYMAIEKKSARDFAVLNRERIQEEEIKKPFYGLVPIMNAMIQKPNGLKCIDTTSEQEANLISAFKNYKSEWEQIAEKAKDPDFEPTERYRQEVKLNDQTGKAYFNILLPHQLREIQSWIGNQRNFIRLLTETPVGDFYGLDSGQQERIARKTLQSMQELEQKIEETRQNLKADLFRELSPEQRAAFERDFGSVIERQLFESSCNGLIDLFGERKMPTPAK
jgi:hypothetical protein